MSSTWLWGVCILFWQKWVFRMEQERGFYPERDDSMCQHFPTHSNARPAYIGCEWGCCTTFHPINDPKRRKNGRVLGNHRRRSKQSLFWKEPCAMNSSKVEKWKASKAILEASEKFSVTENNWAGQKLGDSRREMQIRQLNHKRA